MSNCGSQNVVTIRDLEMSPCQVNGESSPFSPSLGTSGYGTLKSPVSSGDDERFSKNKVKKELRFK